MGKDLNVHFDKDVQVDEYKTRCLISLVIKKYVLKHQWDILSPIRMAKNKMKNKYICLVRILRDYKSCIQVKNVN